MKLKKSLSIILLLTITFGLFSCSKDETAPEIETIVGKWELVSEKSSYLEDGIVIEEVERDYSDYVKKPLVEFKADGSGINTDYDAGGGEPTLVEEFTYVVDNNKLSIKFEDWEAEYTFTILNNTIKLESEEVIGDGVERVLSFGNRVK